MLNFINEIEKGIEDFYYGTGTLEAMKVADELKKQYHEIFNCNLTEYGEKYTKKQLDNFRLDIIHIEEQTKKVKINHKVLSKNNYSLFIKFKEAILDVFMYKRFLLDEQEGINRIPSCNIGMIESVNRLNKLYLEIANI